MSANRVFVSENVTERKGFKVPQRYVVMLLSFLSNIYLLCFRVIPSVAIVYMTPTSDPGQEGDRECSISVGNLSDHPISHPEFNWSRDKQSTILGAYFWGFISTQFIGGMLATRFGAKLLLGLGTGIPAILTLLTPVVARLHADAFIALRVLMGVFAGVCVPSSFLLMSNWCPISEIAFFGSVMYNGINVGSFLGLGATGYLCTTTVDGGWPLPFYIFGSSGLLWWILWLVFGSDDPIKNSYISQEELLYLKANIESNSGDKSVPWLKMLTCVPYFAIICGFIAHNWVLDFSNITIPSYLGRNLGFNISDNGVLSGLPFLLKIPFSVLLSIICDWIYRKFHLQSTTWLRKAFSCIGFIGAAISFLAVPFAKCNQILAVSLLCIGLAFSGIHCAGFLYVSVEMAPKFAGVMTGIANTFANTPGFVVPAIVADLTSQKDTLHQWSIIFYITAGVETAAAVIFVVFGSSKRQSWA